MARLYADEQFPRAVSQLLRTMGHDVFLKKQIAIAVISRSIFEVLLLANL